ncbi:MAG: hypothetical protein ACREPJ_12080 [Rhodanobacteraceae bacterium]
MHGTLQWFRMYAEFAFDPVVQCLAFEDQRHFVMLLCLKCNGTLDRDVSPDVRDRIVGSALGLASPALDEAKRRLIEVDLIDVAWQPVAWQKRQFRSDADSTAAERQRRRRAKRDNHLPGVTDPSRVTSRARHAPVTRPETETETERASVLPKEPGRTESIAAAMDAPPAAGIESPETATTQGDSTGIPRRPCPVERIVALYHEKLPMCRRVEALTPNRRAYIRNRWSNELPSLEAFGNYFDDVAASRFLTGRVDTRHGRTPFVADIDWLMKPGNLVKVLEGKYHDRQ